MFVRAGNHIERNKVASFYIYSGTHLFRPLKPPVPKIDIFARCNYASKFLTMCIDAGYPVNARPSAPYRIPPKGKRS